MPAGSCEPRVFESLYARGCDRTGEVPPVPIEAADPKPEGMTPEQEGVWTAQLRPTNRWVFHPALDGCDEEEPIPVPQ